MNQVKTLESPYIFIYVPHPKESKEDKLLINELIKKNKIYQKSVKFNNIEDIILISDIVFSVFSTCNYDSAYMNYYCKKPLSCIYSLLYDKRMVNYFNTYLLDIKKLPIHRHNVVMPVYLKSEVRKILSLKNE